MSRTSRHRFTARRLMKMGRVTTQGFPYQRYKDGTVILYVGKWEVDWSESMAFCLMMTELEKIKVVRVPGFFVSR